MSLDPKALSIFSKELTRIQQSFTDFSLPVETPLGFILHKGPTIDKIRQKLEWINNIFQVIEAEAEKKTPMSPRTKRYIDNVCTSLETLYSNRKELLKGSEISELFEECKTHATHIHNDLLTLVPAPKQSLVAPLTVFLGRGALWARDKFKKDYLYEVEKDQATKQAEELLGDKSNIVITFADNVSKNIITFLKKQILEIKSIPKENRSDFLENFYDDIDSDTPNPLPLFHQMEQILMNEKRITQMQNMFTINIIHVVERIYNHVETLQQRPDLLIELVTKTLHETARNIQMTDDPETGMEEDDPLVNGVLQKELTEALYGFLLPEGGKELSVPLVPGFLKPMLASSSGTKNMMDLQMAIPFVEILGKESFNKNITKLLYENINSFLADYTPPSEEQSAQSQGKPPPNPLLKYEKELSSALSEVASATFPDIPLPKTALNSLIETGSTKILNMMNAISLPELFISALPKINEKLVSPYVNNLTKPAEKEVTEDEIHQLEQKMGSSLKGLYTFVFKAIQGSISEDTFLERIKFGLQTIAAGLAVAIMWLLAFLPITKRKMKEIIHQASRVTRKGRFDSLAIDILHTLLKEKNLEKPSS